MPVHILAIESSCDDTAAAVVCDGRVLSNVIANQEIHSNYGGVIPELASRAHQSNILPVVDEAIRRAGIAKTDLDAVAFTRGPGLIGSLLVGASFAKGLALSLDIPLISVDHLEAHVLAHFAEHPKPSFPFLCLTVSGGHTQIARVNSHFDVQLLGRTLDDAAGEAFDKAGKMMGLPYPAGPHIDRLAASGNPYAFAFPEPKTEGLDFSFSGLKTAILYFLNDMRKKNPDFVRDNLNDLCASIQHTIVGILVKKLDAAARQTGIREIAIAGGVSANSLLRKKIHELAGQNSWKAYIPAFEYCTDNAAMVGIAGYYKFLEKNFCPQDIAPYAR